MTDLKSQPKPAFRRTSSTTSLDHSCSRSSTRLEKSRRSQFILPVQEEKELPPLPSELPTIRQTPLGLKEPPGIPRIVSKGSETTSSDAENPRFVVENASPDLSDRTTSGAKGENKSEDPSRLGETDARINGSSRPTLASRRHSPISFDHTPLLPFHKPNDSPTCDPQRTSIYRRPQGYTSMPNRKIWVKRPNAVATKVSISEDDLVDDVKDMILRKYANSLGRNFDPPDVALKIATGPHSSRHTNERTLAPDESISKIMDLHYPGGQSIEEALLIDIPQRRTPKHSPRVALPYYMSDDLRPAETGTDYFPPMPIVGPQSPHLPTNMSTTSGHSVSRPPPNPHPHPHSIAVLETSHVPNLPSPGATTRLRHSDRNVRPRYGRQHTSSPTVIAASTHPPNHDMHKVTANPAIPSPSLPPPDHLHRTATPPPPRTSSPRPNPKTKRGKKGAANDEGATSPGLLGGSVPPINVLIVEDNIINLKLLEAFLKRLNVRWSTAMNGEIAVNKWREGGFHLVLMDIQLPVMNGLEATKEIRRLERVNKIGVFVNNAGSRTPVYEKSPEEALNGTAVVDEDGAETQKRPKQEDDLKNLMLFRSPVIIVALTASSLQSDRHEALAAGCNDFLTKPVNFDWLSRKVMEWGCMQALIDFDGWRKWKDFSSTKTSPQEEKKRPNGVTKGPKSPLMNGKQRKFLGMMDGGGSSSEDTGDASSKTGV